MATVQNPPEATKQKLHAMEITRLKSLADVVIGFDDHPLTAIMGTNCSGKTTVLHALACAYQPTSSGGGYKFPQFFKPNSDSLWQGSRFAVSWSQRIGAKIDSKTTVFEKVSDRWTPRYEKRPVREVRLLMIRDSVPEVEVYGQNTMVHYAKTVRTKNVDVLVRVNRPGLVQTIDRLGQGVVVAVATAAHRGLYACLSQAFGIEN